MPARRIVTMHKCLAGHCGRPEAFRKRPSKDIPLAWALILHNKKVFRNERPYD